MRLYDQQARLPELKAERPTLARVQSQVQSQVLQNVAVRIDLACQAVLRRVQTGEVPGSPRFRGKGRSDRFTLPPVPVGCHLDVEAKDRRVMHVGLVKLVLHRPLAGTPTTATLHRSSTGTWSGCCSCECVEPAPLPATGQEVGIAVGRQTFAMLTQGEPLATPRLLRQDERALAGAQRRLSRAEQGTPARAARRRRVARSHERIAWRRGDFAQQHSHGIVDQVDLSAVEDRAVNRMVHKHGLAKSLDEAAWTPFAAGLAHQAAWAGRRFVAVHPASTSQDCSGCGHRQPRSLSDRTSTCPCCGLLLDRDRTAARTILRLAQAHLRLGQQSLASA